MRIAIFSLISLTTLKLILAKTTYRFLMNTTHIYRLAVFTPALCPSHSFSVLTKHLLRIICYSFGGKLSPP